MTLEEFAREMERVAAALLGVQDETARWAQNQALFRAVQYSSGSASAATLRAAGHPYARRRRGPGLDPSIINVQSGTFRRSWAPEGPHRLGDTVIASVFNADEPVAGYLAEGTDPMFARPLANRVVAELEPRVEERYAEALDALMGD